MAATRVKHSREAVSAVEAAYMAGFFDGEGSVVIYKRKTLIPKGATAPYNMRVTVTNTSHEAILWIRGRFGGNVCEYAPGRGNRQRSWKWTALCRDARFVLESMMPFLVIKRREAQIALEFQSLVSETKRRKHPGIRGTPPLAAEDIAARDALADALIEERAARIRRQLQTH